MFDINPELSNKNRDLMSKFVIRHKKTLAVEAHVRSHGLPLMEIKYKVKDKHQQVAYRYTTVNEAKTLAQKSARLSVEQAF